METLDYKSNLEKVGWIAVDPTTGRTLEASWGSEIIAGKLIGPVIIGGQTYFLRADYFETNKTNPPQEVASVFDIVREETATVFPQHRKIAFFTDQYQRVCACVTIDAGGTANYPIRSKAFRGIAAVWVMSQKDRFGNPRPPTSENINTYLTGCEAKAYLDKIHYEIYNRAARFDQEYYIDLGDKYWRVVTFNKSGWEVLEGQPYPMFMRYGHMQPLVIAQKGSKIAFARFIDLLHVSVEYRMQIEVYAVLTGLAGIQQVILYLIGSQGSIKSTSQELLGSIFDPTITETLTLPRQQRELIQQLMHHYIPVFDNVDFISDELASDLCRGCTGGGFEKRLLYTDDDDLIYRYLRKIMLNGVSIGNHRPDFVERCLVISQERVAIPERRQKSVVMKEGKELLPEVRAYCLDVLVLALNEYEVVSKELEGKLPRMADYCIWGECVARGLGYEKLAFYQSYMDLQGDQTINALLSDAVGELLISWLQNNEVWKTKKTLEVSPNILHSELKSMAEGRGYNLRTIKFPGSPTWLTNKLNGLKHSLAEYGIKVDTGIRGRKNNSYCISDCSTSSTTPQSRLQKDDGAIPGCVEQQDRVTPNNAVVDGGASGVSGVISGISSDAQQVERLPGPSEVTPKGGSAGGNATKEPDLKAKGDKCSGCGFVKSKIYKFGALELCSDCITREQDKNDDLAV
jgi:hypothetical protein